MSIKNKKIDGLKDLQNTLITHDHIEEVHFTKNGNHYFQAYDLLDENGKKTGKRYGSLGFDYVNDPKSKENKSKKINVANPAAEIVETLSREEALNFTVPEEAETEKRGRPAKTN